MNDEKKKCYIESLASFERRIKKAEIFNLFWFKRFRIYNSMKSFF